MTQTNIQEMAISLATKKEILFDINNGLFSEDYETNSKYYHDEENDLDIEVLSEMNQLNGMWQFDVMIADSNGDEYILDEGQWLILNKALMQDIEWRNEEARSEAEHIKQLWRSAYA